MEECEKQGIKIIGKPKYVIGLHDNEWDKMWFQDKYHYCLLWGDPTDACRIYYWSTPDLGYRIFIMLRKKRSSIWWKNKSQNL